jgi:hypothetical protein
VACIVVGLVLLVEVSKGTNASSTEPAIPCA